MNIKECFPSRFLAAVDLNGQSVRVIMERVEIEDVGDDTDKPVLYFKGKEKGLIINKTNSNNISALYGDETEDWIGHEIMLYEQMVDFKGRSVPAIRVRAPQTRDRAPQHARNVNGASAAIVAPRPRPTVAQELNDDVPF